MTEPSDPSKTPSDITRLLLKAVRGLPEDEQRSVFEYFFERGMGAQQHPLFEQFIHGAAELPATGQRGAWREPSILERGGWLEPTSLATLFTAQKPMGPDQIMIPVRLSQAQHRRLKQWCAEHNFPMAVVVRGLVDRFLNSWEKRAA